MKRTFFAITIKPGEKLDKTIHIVRVALAHEKIKWVDTSHLHLTLRFLGDTREEDILAMIKDVSDAVHNLPPLKLEIQGLGLFASLHNPRVIWAGTRPDDRLNQLQQEIESIVVDHGFVPESKPFSPHFTLGRIKEIKSREQLKQLLDRFGNETFETIRVSEVVMYESQLKAEGPVYTSLHVFNLAGASDTGSFNNG